MKLLGTIIIFLVFQSAYGHGVNDSDKRAIYQLLIEKTRRIPVLNQTWSRIDKWDIDGQTVKHGWPYCGAVPIKYQILPLAYCESIGFKLDTLNIFKQIDANESDSLDKYLPKTRLISKRRAPMHSLVGNVFKCRKVLTLSPILFDNKNNLALVKIQDLRWHYSNWQISMIILEKKGNFWHIVSSIPLERHQAVRMTSIQLFATLAFSC